MTENEIEISPVRRPSWRDNKAVLWLVRIGFLLQFYIPAVVCCVIMLAAFLQPPFTMGRDDPHYMEYAFYENLRWDFFIFSILTLILLAVQCIIGMLILRSPKTRFAGTVLWCLIVFNVLHGFVWMLAMWPVTLIRLTPPTILYGIAFYVEWRTARNAEAGVSEAIWKLIFT